MQHSRCLSSLGKSGLRAGAVARCAAQPRAQLATAAPATTPTPAATFFDPIKKVSVPVPAAVAALFQPITVGSLQLDHRIVMAPLTRCRAIDRVPTPAMAEYYSQRASRGGLIVSEATIVTPTGAGYSNTPGMYTDAQVAAWRPIVDAVHAKGGVILCQLWHCGRQSHREFQPDGALPVAPSAIAPGAPWQVYAPKAGMVDYDVPRALEHAECKELSKVWGAAAKNAMAAGFDGVEIHGANGYLLDQFLKSGCNTRTDEYGGSIENRARLTLEITRAVIATVGDAGRVGIRVSPFMNFGDSIDATPYATHVYLSEQLKALKMAYLHMTESRTGLPYDDNDATHVESLTPFRLAFAGKFIAAGAYKRDDAAKAISSGHCDLVAFGRPFVSTPDLPARLLADVAPNPWDRATFYTSDQEKGFTDYPFMGLH